MGELEGGQEKQVRSHRTVFIKASDTTGTVLIICFTKNFREEVYRRVQKGRPMYGFSTYHRTPWNYERVHS